MMLNTEAAKEQLFNNIALGAGAILFCGVPVYYLSMAIVRRYRLRLGKGILFGGAFGLLMACLLMIWFQNGGALGAFCAIIGGYFGARRGSEMVERKAKLGLRRKRRKRSTS